MNTDRFSIPAFIALAILWGIIVYYTIVPWSLGISLPSSTSIDISPFTWILVAMALTGTAMWFFMQITYLFVRKGSLQEHSALVQRGQHSSDPLVSIIIPARNEESVIKRTISSCLSQTYKKIEVIVVCHNCTDGTYHQAQSDDSRVMPYEYKTAEAGKGIALNFGVTRSSGEYVLVLDSDGILANDFIVNALPFFDKGFAAIQGKIVASNREYNRHTKFLALEGELYSTPFMTVRSRFEKRAPLGGTGVMINKEALVRAGGFRNALIDDFELSFRLYRLGERIAFAPLSIVYDEKPPKFESIVRQRSRWVKGHLDLLKERIPEPKDLFGHIYWLNPIFMLGSFAAFMLNSVAVLSFMLFGAMPFKFSFLPIMAWLAVTFGSMILQLVIMTKEFGTTGLKYAGYVMLLPIYSHYWYISLIKSFFVKSWATTKTSHGFVSERDLEEMAINSRRVKDEEFV